MKTLVVLLGPTGVGKTELSLRLAEHFNSPVLSADSRQLYKGLSIGTAAPTAADLQRVKHYFVGRLELTDYYSASQFEDEAIQLLSELHRKQDVVLMSGGSMMYIDAVCHGIDDMPTIDSTLRMELLDIFDKEGLESLRLQLKILDPVFYNQVDLKNHKRVLHALEICLMTGKPYSELRMNTVKNRPFQIIKIGLIRNREELYDRINRRVDQMMSDGLLEEAQSVYPLQHLNSLNTVGYKELFQYFAGNWSLDFAIEKIKQNSRIYSRKQMTWLKKDKEITWFHPEDEAGILEYITTKH
ncbi:MAG: tRNA dimethylallyltransferase [Candidatus Ordinivivax streblomastigis]|uniref:tRNA dimethylallyltransferase n=1 Tax=Candidatus Ordinivivax streblomastigis TaxID=2540710 RepID=A0A5M8P0Z4_9BACT|nr:MAG: tRNA dimethylallyltransferase [Candidatus Ordinivivax streblomastigis]